MERGMTGIGGWFSSPRGRLALRLALLIVSIVGLAAIASTFGITTDFRYLDAAVSSGSQGGNYHALATRLSERAARQRGRLTVLTSSGSLDNMQALRRENGRCRADFAFAQDGTPVPPDAALQVLGRLPEAESLLILARRDRPASRFSDLHGATLGIGPDGSGTAYLVRRLLADPDLMKLGIRTSVHELRDQAALVAEGKLDFAAFVMSERATFIREIIQAYDLDIVSPVQFDGLLERHPWLGSGRIAMGRYDLLRPTPSADRTVARVDTLVLAGACTTRAERVIMLMLLSAELPNFLRVNPPPASGSVTTLPLAPEARQFFSSGEPELADRYVPWAVDLMSPAYWVYLVMAVTVLFNAMSGFNRFRLWRIDAAREKLEIAVEAVAGPGPHPEKRARARLEEATPERRRDAERLARDVVALRGRARRYAASVFTPMGDELYYRYQEALMEEDLVTLAAIAGSRVDEPGAAAAAPWL